MIQPASANMRSGSVWNARFSRMGLPRGQSLIEPPRKPPSFLGGLCVATGFARTSFPVGRGPARRDVPDDEETWVLFQRPLL